MKRVLLLLAVLLVSCGTVIAQTNQKNVDAKKAQKEAKKAAEQAEQMNLYNEAMNAINAKDFVLEADKIIFKRGNFVYVNSNVNFVSMKDDRATIQLSFNFAPSGPNGLGGITVDGTVSGFEMKTDKKGLTTLSMAVMNGKETQNPVQSNALEIKTGIFFKDNGKYTKILPTVFSGSKANTLGAALTGGIASASVKSIMNNAHSNNVISSNRPEFMFYFARNNNDAFRISQTNWWFTSASSPNEFALVRLDIKKNKREMVIGTVNLYSGTKTGVDDVHNVSFKIEAVDDYTFKVTPKHVLIVFTIPQ